MTVLQVALPGIELELMECRKVFSETEQFTFEGTNGQGDDNARWSNSWDEQVFVFHLKRLRLFRRMALEAAGLQSSLAQFDSAWEGFTDLTATEVLHEVDSLLSEPLELMKNTMDGIRVLGGVAPVRSSRPMHGDFADC